MLLQDSTAAIGGLGPLIINGLKYGDINRYNGGVPKGAPLTGEPGPEYKKYLIQRSNLTYARMAEKGPQVGKTIVAHSSNNKLFIIIQPDGTGSMDLNAIRDNLSKLGFDNAVFLDGSDSSMLIVNQKIKVEQGENKDETNTIGLKRLSG